MADAEATAVIKIKADTTAAVRETDKLTSAQERLSKSVQGAGSGFGKMIDGAAVGLAKFNLAMGGISTGLGMLKAGLDTAREVEGLRKLEAALPTSAVDRLSKITAGFIDRTSAMRLGVKGLTGDFALNQVQMEKVMQAAIALEQRGFGPAAQTADKMLEALGPKGVGKLDDFGIELEKTGNRQNDVNAAMEKFDAIIANNPIDERTKSMAALNASMEEATQTIQRFVSEVVMAFAKIVKDWNEFGLKAPPTGQEAVAWYENAHGRGGIAAGTMARYSAGAAQAHMEWYRRTRPAGSGVLREGYADPVLQNYRDAMPFTGATDIQMDFTGDGMTIGRSPSRGGRGGSSWSPSPYRPSGEEGLGWQGQLSGTLGRGRAGLGEVDPLQDLNLGARTPFKGLDGGFGELLGSLSEDKMGKLQKDMADTMSLVGGGFATLNAGITAAVDAAITGQEGIGKAAAKASAQVLKALAIEATGRAIYEGALALGSLAMLDPRGAAMHGAAAGKYAAAAAGLGVLAGGLGQAVGAFGGGGGGGGSAGAAGGGFGRPATAGQSGGGGVNVTINIGDGFVGEPQKLADMIAKHVESATRKGRIRTDHTSTFSGS